MQAQSAVHIRACRVQQMIVAQAIPGRDLVDQLQPLLRAVSHGYGDRVIQRDHGRGLQPF